MNWWDTVSSFAGSTWAAISNVGGDVGAALTRQWKFTASLFKGAIYQLTHPINTVEQNAAILAGLLTGNLTAVHNALNRLEGWAQQRITRPILSWTRRQIARLWAALDADRRMLWRRITQVSVWAHRYAWKLTAAERAQRRRGDRAAEAYARAQAKAALGTVQREAASGYQVGRDAQVSTAVKILDDLVVRDPLLKEAVGKLVTVLLDATAIEDPLLRLVAGFVLQHAISDLGVEKPLGDLARSLLGPLLGQPSPRNLHDVIMALSDRTGAMESQWAQFMADGGPQILQAGKLWRDVTSLGEDAALLAFAVGAVADPSGTAKALSDVIRPLGTTTIATVASTLAGK